MAAKDYVFQVGWRGIPYLAKKIKSRGLISHDRREVEDNEIMALFETYLRRWTKEHPEETLVVSLEGKEIFEAKLLDKEK